MLYFSISKIAGGRSPKRRVRDDDFMFRLFSDYLRICSECPRIVFLLAEALHCATAEILSVKTSWHAQCLVRLKGEFTCSAHCK